MNDIFSPELQEKLKQIADHYGIDTQVAKLAEECAEISAAALKTRVYAMMMDVGHPAEYVEPKFEEAQDAVEKELADVMTVAYQVLYLAKDFPDFQKRLEQNITAKADRQLTRIAEEKSYGNQ